MEPDNHTSKKFRPSTVGAFIFDAKRLILLYNSGLTKILTTAQEVWMIDQPLSGARPLAKGGFQERTFMGGIGVGTRASLFVILAIAVLITGAFALIFADKQLNKANLALTDSVDLSSFVAGIERDVWRIRAESGELSKRLANSQFAASDAGKAATQEHVALANTLGLRLDELYIRPGAEVIGEQASTLREAVAQYMEQYSKSAKNDVDPAPDLTGLETRLRQAIRTINKSLNTVNILSLNETMADIRAVTTEFIESGASRNLATIENAEKEFVHLLTAVPISSENKSALMLGMIGYQSSMSAYAKDRLVHDNTRDRLEEIVSYMVPSVDAITGFAGDNLAQTQKQYQIVRQKYRTLIASGIAGAFSLILFFGVAMLRSISGPIIATARAARNLSAGNSETAVRGLGNADETGDIARALLNIKDRLSEADKLRDTMKKAKTEGERGRAASAEAEWLRRDLESMKAEVDKGKQAIAEVALLRKIIDATADSISEKQIGESKTPDKVIENAVPPAAAPEATDDASLDKISTVSRQVARSSEYVTAAADEAERTGTLIRNLSYASEKIDAMEALITNIGEQADMLVVNTPEQGSDTNLVVLNGTPERIDGVTRRFDIIRSTASHATWAVRDIGAMIKDSREVALDIARLSSAEALEVTTDLLQQSENLRGMLDNLVNQMQDQVIDETLMDVQKNEEDGPSGA
jgi:HAMP domain-containing protein